MEFKKPSKTRRRCSEFVPGDVFVTDCGSYFMRTVEGYVDLLDGDVYKAGISFEYAYPVKGYFQETE